MSVTKRARFVVLSTALVVVLAGGCSRFNPTTNNKPSQTGTPKTTTTTTTTSTTLAAVPDASGATTTVPGPGGAKLVDGKAPAARTITITNGTFDPPNLTVNVGETVTFKSGDNVAYDVTVGDLQPSTVTKDLLETFQFFTAGPVTVSQDQSSLTATITVFGERPVETTTTSASGGSTTSSTTTVAGGASSTTAATGASGGASTTTTAG